MDGILIVNKPKGLTSRDVVNILNKKFHTKKIGHTGTLDPMATGVLVCLIGKYTKLSNVITSDKKEYEASFDLGYFTHLYTDKLWFEEFIPSLTYNTSIKLLKTQILFLVYVHYLNLLI